MNDKTKEVIIHDPEINNLIMKKDDLQDGQFELVDEVNARQTHKNLLDAVKNGDVEAVKAALESGANTSYDEPKALNAKDFDMTHVAQDYVINTDLKKGVKGDVIMGDIHGLPAMSESQMTMFVLHELGQMEAGNVARNLGSLKEEKTGLTLGDSLKGTEGNSTFLKLDADGALKDLSKLMGHPLGYQGADGNLNSVDPAALRDKFNSADKKDKNTPK